MKENSETRSNFELKKAGYFTKLGLKVRETLKLHKGVGALWGEEGTREDWRNVTEHCLVETARANAFASLLGFSDLTKKNLILAAAAHDFNKRYEMESTKREGRTLGSFERAYSEATRRMEEAGLPDQVIRLADSVGWSASPELQKILSKTNLSEDDIAYLVMHYLDDYTVQSEWANPAETSAEGKKINDLDRRMENNKKNPNYKVLDEDGRKRFEGKSTFEMQHEMGVQVEQKLAQLIEEISGQIADSKDLPVFIDEIIKQEIASENSI